MRPTTGPDKVLLIADLSCITQIWIFLLVKAENDDIMNNVIFTACSKNTFSSVVQRLGPRQPIQDDVVIVPERASFSESVIVKFGIWGFSFGDLQYHIDDEKKQAIDYIMMTR